MFDIVRDSAFGQFARLFVRGRAVSYPEEKPGFEADVYYNSGSPTTSQVAVENANTHDPTASTLDAQDLTSQSNDISKCNLK